MINLSEISTVPPSGLKKENIKEETKDLAQEIADLQARIYAEKKHSVLIVLQGMDASGKDGITKNVFRYCNASGISAYSFKKPTDLEFAHDFLWRVHKQAPTKGHIQIFIRSHYEDILIQRVHRWIDEDRVKARMNAINNFERLLIADNNTTILKFFLHISKSRQEEKLQERIEVPRKNWKHNPDDWKEREHWEEYMACYQDAINWSKIPWHIVPVDSRWYRNYVVAKITLEKLKSLNPRYPVIKKK